MKSEISKKLEKIRYLRSFKKIKMVFPKGLKEFEYYITIKRTGN
jgi:hypothetical protein